MHSLAEERRIVARLSQIGIALSAENDQAALLEMILIGAKEITGCDGGTIYAVQGQVLDFEIIRTDSLGIIMGGTSGEAITFPPVPLYRSDGSPNMASVVAQAVLCDRTINIIDAYATEDFDFSGTRNFDAHTGYHSQSFLTVPMKNHEGEIIGVLQLINAQDPASGAIIAFDDWHQRLAESLASQAATALTRNHLIADMRELFEALIKLIAQAIDDKSPYTGGHCRRVPELTMQLADAVVAHQTGPLADFTMSEEDRYALQIASWLHDCGKLTVPDWVMDKATKLAGLNDRIEVIAARFAARERELEIAYLRGCMLGGEERALAMIRDQGRERLREDLLFLRRANVGGEFMRDEDVQRISDIARQTWIDSTGTEAPLLSPEEVALLSIRRGTLSAEERTIINGHMDATLRMLEGLPYPRHLQQVPEYAGGHHEHMDGSGYPRGLTREEMSVPARLMGIADIFEALTAADRPYKKPMPLSQALTILGRMKCEGHIDPDIFDIFIRERVYLRYAERFLRPEQIDPVDLHQIPGYDAH